MIPCFAAERTLGKLTKWLRLLGFDTLAESDLSDKRFFDKIGDDRILLTRTQWVRKKFAARKLIFIDSDHLEQQMVQIFRELKLTAAQTRPFSRCLLCNVQIEAIAKSALQGKVPDYIFETHDQFNRCPKCGRIFWPGSHTHRSLKKIQQLLNLQ